MYAKRIESARERLASLPVESLIISHPPIVRWLSGFTGSRATLYLDGNQQILITDGRYAEQAHQQAADYDVRIHRDAWAALMATLSGGSVGYLAEHTSVNTLHELEDRLEDTAFTPIPNVFSTLMADKDKTETDRILAAQAITDKVFSELTAGVIKIGMTEKQLAAEIVYRQLQHGADGIPHDFWPIVASGPNSALPHAEAGDRRLQKGDVLLLDYGCTVDGYVSDMSRTVVLGPATQEIKTVYEIVLQAQKAALATARAGLTGKELDSVARKIITAAGYDIPHSLGHGVGLELHEWPTAGPRNTQPLPSNAVITIEPGVYLPGRFGVRIEDMVQLQKDGSINLTASPKELICLPV